MRTRSGVAAVVMLAVLGSAERTRAGGFDTPILYTAQHQGMGGTAIGYVDDASAVFHNPAGLQNVRCFNAVGDLSLLMGKIQSSPAAGAGARSVKSDLAVGPFFLISAAYRVHPWITLAAAFYPVGYGGASYVYDNTAGDSTRDETRLVFFEASPALSVNVPRDEWLPGLLSFGVGYRIDVVDFSRTQRVAGAMSTIDLDMNGTRATGVRAGVQWRPDDHFSAGAVFRNEVDVRTSADRGTAFGLPVTDPQLTFVLPAKVGLGARYDIAAFGFAADGEYGFYSANDRQPVRAEIGGAPMETANVFDWQNAITLRAGAEYRLGAKQNIPVRIGYVFDGKVTSRRFPSPFDTPPAPTHSLTAGAGIEIGVMKFDVAYAYRFGSTTVHAGDLAPRAECPLCGFAGKYGLQLHGVYFDVVVDLPKDD
jgi:long-subunit fatty acid transport protein